MFATKYRTNKLCKLKSTVMQQQEILLNQENQQLKQVLFMFPSLLPKMSQASIEGKFM